MFPNIDDHISHVVINRSLPAWILGTSRLTVRAVRTYGHLYCMGRHKINTIH